MVRSSSLFSQLLSLIPRAEFERLVGKHRADKGSKGFSCWTQFVAMLERRRAYAPKNKFRFNLFTYRDLWDWLDDPFDTLPIAPEQEQLSLQLNMLDST